MSAGHTHTHKLSIRLFLTRNSSIKTWWSFCKSFFVITYIVTVDHLADTKSKHQRTNHSLYCTCSWTLDLATHTNQPTTRELNYVRATDLFTTKTRQKPTWMQQRKSNNNNRCEWKCDAITTEKNWKTYVYIRICPGWSIRSFCVGLLLLYTVMPNNSFWFRKRKKSKCEIVGFGILW